MTDTTRAPRVEIRDAGVMRALAHPARLSIMERLMSGEPATATECAEIIGLTPSATSYHLRALAKAGLVEEAPSRGDGRERLWRSLAPGGLNVDAGHRGDPATVEAERELIDTYLIHEEARVRQWVGRMHDEPKDWYEATMFTEMRLLLTVDELAELATRIGDLLEPYRGRFGSGGPAGARPVSIFVRAFPTAPPPAADGKPSTSGGTQPAPGRKPSGRDVK